MEISSEGEPPFPKTPRERTRKGAHASAYTVPAGKSRTIGFEVEHKEKKEVGKDEKQYRQSEPNYITIVVKFNREKNVGSETNKMEDEGNKRFRLVHERGRIRITHESESATEIKRRCRGEEKEEKTIMVET